MFLSLLLKRRQFICRPRGLHFKTLPDFGNRLQIFLRIRYCSGTLSGSFPVSIWYQITRIHSFLGYPTPLFHTYFHMLIMYHIQYIFLLPQHWSPGRSTAQVDDPFFILTHMVNCIFHCYASQKGSCLFQMAASFPFVFISLVPKIHDLFFNDLQHMDPSGLWS